MAKPATALWPKKAVRRGSKAGALANLLIGEIPLARNDCYQPEPDIFRLTDYDRFWPDPDVGNRLLST